MEEEDSSDSCSGSSRPLDPGMAKHHGLTLTSVWLSPLSEKASKDDFQVFSALKKKDKKHIFKKKKKVLILGRRLPCAVWIPSLVSSCPSGDKDPWSRLCSRDGPQSLSLGKAELISVVTRESCIP